MSKMKSCDCNIGFLRDENLTIQTIKSKIDELFEYQNMLRRNLDELNIPNPDKLFPNYAKAINVVDLFDNRKLGSISKYNYCPYCGKKIDWKEIKENCCK